MSTTFWILLIIIIAALALLFYAILTAPTGEQDEDGYHCIKKPEDKKKKDLDSELRTPMKQAHEKGPGDM